MTDDYLMAIVLSDTRDAELSLVDRGEELVLKIDDAQRVLDREGAERLRGFLELWLTRRR